MEPSTLTAVVTLTAEQATTVRRALPWQRPAVTGWLAGVVGALVLGWPAIALVTGEGWTGLLGVGLFALLWLPSTLLLPWSAPRRRPVVEGVAGPVMWTFTPAGVGLDSVLGTGFRPWQQVDEVLRRGRLLVLTHRTDQWASGLPTAALPADSEALLRQWWAAARQTPAEPPQGLSAVPVPEHDGADLVLAGRLTPDVVRALQWGGLRLAGLGRRSVAVLAAVAVGLLLAAATVLDGRRPAAVALALAPVVLGVAIEALVRATARRHADRVVGWRLGPSGIGVAIDGAWHHTPWSRVTRLLVTPTVLLCAPQDVEVPFAVPLAGFSDADGAAVTGWAAGSGAQVRFAGRQAVPTAPASTG